MEGYFAEPGRAGSGQTGFDYAREVDSGGKKVAFKDLPPLEQEGAHTLDEMWTNIGYFLKAVVPAAEQAGVPLAVHPHDPPAPVSRRAQQVMSTLARGKQATEDVQIPPHGDPVDCSV